MKLEQFIARVAARLRESVPTPGNFGLPFRVVLGRAPAHVLGEFEPFVRLQPIHGVFDFREAHRRETYELWPDKQGGSWSGFVLPGVQAATRRDTAAARNQKSSQGMETPV